MPALALQRAEEFFDHYGAVLSRGDLEGIASCYSYPSLVVTDTASRAISSPEEIMEAFAGTCDLEEENGPTTAVAHVQSIESSAANVAWVTVRWSYRDLVDEEMSADAYRYLLREIESAVEICTVTPVPVDWNVSEALERLEATGA